MTSDALKAAVFAGETGEAFIALLTITHDDLAQPIRVCNDAVDTISNGDTFLAFPFEITLPVDDPKRPPNARLVIDNVDQTIITAFRALASPPVVGIEIILASDPDTIEVSLPDFKIRNIEYDAQTIEGDLTLEDFSREPYPAGIFDPSRFRGGF